ncbi:SIS domain-containing protein [Hoeflea prorocentri]|uniref:SIS domain-containing protein n=1 Tax=Hoeflea prorocentri TaxID=1922333 RepID=A0A9X3ZGW9_9HYPH|nr:SIS domain-containing protein [Hoeflea prorocentri]MCY6380190.1 SIS domain-containing protein [Hoeflea prorocentri]MDA5397990.1 SIS domain-containing protein [Hoeflea prorocentri]
MTNISQRYLNTVIERLQKVSDTQADAISQAAEICAAAIMDDKLVFTFGTGHGSFAAMEMFPRTGTVTGFRPIVESSMISFHRVLGDGGARQYRFIHGQEGYGDAILSSHQTVPGDAMLIFSHSGLNAVTLDIAVDAKERGMKLIGVTSVPHSSSTPSRHTCGKRLFELADVVIDTGVPKGDAGIEIEGLKYRVGATSTSIAIAVGQAINAATAEILVEKGHEPFVMVSPNTAEKAEANKQNDKNYAELWRRLKMR